MKKKRFMGLLALASCVTLLTGCESNAFFGLGKYVNQVGDGFNGILEKLGLKKAEQKEEKQSEEEKQQSGEQGGEQQGGGEQEQPATPTLTVAELPAKLDVRESLDLDQYVTITNLESYSVELASESANLASLEGHVLTALGEGEIKFTVSAGELSKACSISCVSSVREFLIEQFNEAKNRYSIIEYDYDQTAEEYYMSDYVIHSSRYLLTKYFDYDANQNIVPGGWLSFDDEDLFEYTLQENAQSEVEVVLGDQANSVYFDVYNPEIETAYYFQKNGTYEYDEEYKVDMIVLEGDPAIFWAQEAMMRYQGKVSGQSTTYTVARVEFYLEEYQDEKVLNYMAYVTDDADETNKLLSFSYGEIWLGDDAGYALMDAYCVPENKPVAIDYWNYFSKFNLTEGLGDFFISTDDTACTPCAGLYSLEYGWCDDNGDPIACPTTGAFSYMPVGSKMMFLSENSVWDVSPVYDETTGDLLGYNPNSGKMLVEGEGTDPDVVYDIYSSQTSYTAIEAEEAKVWADEDLVFAGLRDRDNYAPGCFSEAKDYGDENGDYLCTVFTFQDGKSAGLIDALIDGDDGLYYLGYFISYYATNYGRNLYNYFGGTLTVYPMNGIVQLRLEFSWDDNQNWAVTFTSQYAPSAATQCANFEAYMLANAFPQA